MNSKVQISTLLFIFVIALASAHTNAQAPVKMTLDEFLNTAAKERQAYIDGFRDLTAPESKTFTLFNKDGEVKKTRSVRSLFLVYQLKKRSGTQEIRSVISVDGKPVSGAEQRSQEFFDKVTKAENVEKEIKSVRDESLRYDDYLLIDNSTLFEAVTLASNLRPLFDFKFIGTEMVNGILTNVVTYDQTQDSEYIGINDKSRADDGKLNLDFAVDVDGKNVSPRLDGKMWFDASNGKLIRELRRLTVKPDKFPSRQVAQEMTFDYAPSNFEIYTPKRIVYTFFDLDKKHEPRKDTMVTFEYGEFTQPHTDVRLLDD